MKPIPIFMTLLVLIGFLFPSTFVFSKPQIQPDILEISGSSKERYIPNNLVLFFQAADTMPESSRLIWTGTVADIPSGWSRDTNFDDRFLQADINFQAYTEPTNAGVEDHNHSSTGLHSLTEASHTHTISGTTTLVQDFVIDITKPLTGSVTVKAGHSLVAAASDVNTVTYTDQNIQIDANVGQPAFVRAIIIKPDNALQEFPANAIAFFNETPIPAGFNITNGLSGTDGNFDARFVLGAITDENGGAFGGDPTHIHESPLHQHDNNAHSHAQKLAGNGSPLVNRKTNAPAINGVANSQHHNVSLDANTTTTASLSVTIDANSSEPQFIEFLGIQNTSGGSLDSFNGIIVPFVGAFSDIPSGWTTVNGNEGTPDAQNKQIKITESESDINSTGGSNTAASHNVPDHTHTHSNVNTHSGTQSVTIASTDVNPGVTFVVGAGTPHNHTLTITEANPTIDDSNTSITAVEERYKYRTVILIKKLGVPEDTCTYNGVGDFVVSCADACLITEDVDLQGNYLVFQNTGTFDLNAAIKRKAGVKWPVDPDVCTMRIYINESGDLGN